MASTEWKCSRQGTWALISLLVVPVLGLLLANAFCWGHPLTWLGPSLLYIGIPAVFIFSIITRRKHPECPLARGAFILSSVEIVLILFLFLFISFSIF